MGQTDLVYSHPHFNGTSHYNINEDCDWIIEANETQNVRVEFTFFALEADGNCTYDQTIVYDGPDDVAPQLSRICGSDVSWRFFSRCVRYTFRARSGREGRKRWRTFARANKSAGRPAGAEKSRERQHISTNSHKLQTCLPLRALLLLLPANTNLTLLSSLALSVALLAINHSDSNRTTTTNN